MQGNPFWTFTRSTGFPVFRQGSKYDMKIYTRKVICFIPDINSEKTYPQKKLTWKKIDCLKTQKERIIWTNPSVSGAFAVSFREDILGYLRSTVGLPFCFRLFFPKVRRLVWHLIRPTWQSGEHGVWALKSGIWTCGMRWGQVTEVVKSVFFVFPVFHVSLCQLCKRYTP